MENTEDFSSQERVTSDSIEEAKVLWSKLKVPVVFKVTADIGSGTTSSLVRSVAMNFKTRVNGSAVASVILVMAFLSEGCVPPTKKIDFILPKDYVGLVILEQSDSGAEIRYLNGKANVLVPKSGIVLLRSLDDFTDGVFEKFLEPDGTELPSNEYPGPISGRSVISFGGTAELKPPLKGFEIRNRIVFGVGNSVERERLHGDAQKYFRIQTTK